MKKENNYFLGLCDKNKTHRYITTYNFHKWCCFDLIDVGRFVNIMSDKTSVAIDSV